MVDKRSPEQASPGGILARMRGAPGSVLRMATVRLVRPTPEQIAGSPENGRVHGVTDAAADQSECHCPEFCERDHANE